MPTPKLTQDILLAAIEGFESQKQRIDAQLTELRQMLNGTPTESAALATPTKGRRKLSAAARARIAEAQRKRWAAQKAAEPAQSAAKPAAPTSKPRRQLSAAGRRAIVEATKRRWARVRTEAAKAAMAQSRHDKQASKKIAKKAPGKRPRKGPKLQGKPRLPRLCHSESAASGVRSGDLSRFALIPRRIRICGCGRLMGFRVALR